jgi:hypothetical protein
LAARLDRAHVRYKCINPSHPRLGETRLRVRLGSADLLLAAAIQRGATILEQVQFDQLLFRLC